MPGRGFDRSRYDQFVGELEEEESERKFLDLRKRKRYCAKIRLSGVVVSPILAEHPIDNTVIRKLIGPTCQIAVTVTYSRVTRKDTLVASVLQMVAAFHPPQVIDLSLLPLDGEEEE